MTDRANPLTVYLTDEEKAQLKEWSNETGKSLSELGRDAILEYTDHDRYDRIESELSTIHNELADLRDTLGEEVNTHAQTPVYKGDTNSVPEKARAVAEHIYDNYGETVQEKDVEIAIENIAQVGDERSVEKYKGQFKKRELLFKHPFQPVWTPNKRQWVKWVEQSHVPGALYDIVDEYRMDTEEYDELATEVTQ